MLKNLFSFNSVKSFKRILNQYRTLVVVLVLAAVSPFMLWLVLSPGSLSLGTKADAQNELRLWFEPGTVVTTPNTATTVAIMASFLAERELIPQLDIHIFVDSQTPLTVNPKDITYKTPFNGRVKLGEVQIIASTRGTHTISFDKQITTSYPKPIQILTAPLIIIVQ